MKKNLTIGLPKRGVVLCEGSAGFHADCTDEPEGDYDVIASHNNWERVKFSFILSTKKKKKNVPLILTRRRVHTLTKHFHSLLK